MRWETKDRSRRAELNAELSRLLYQLAPSLRPKRTVVGNTALLQWVVEYMKRLEKSEQ